MAEAAVLDHGAGLVPGGEGARHGLAGDPAAAAPPVVAPAPPVTPPANDPAPAPRAPTAADPAAPAPAADTPPAPQTWPEKWRELVAGDDKKEVERLARIKDPSQLWKSFREIERDMSSGKYRKVLPVNPTDAELADYRKSNNVPDKPEGYDLNLGNGIVFGETDKPHIDNFLKYAHDRHATPEMVKLGVGWWADYQNHLVDQMNEADTQNFADARAELRSAWGPNETRNKNFIKMQLDGFGEGFYTKLMNSRSPEGVRLGDDPAAMVNLFKLLHERDPESYDLPGNGQGPTETEAEEEAKYNNLMRDKRSAYWKGPDAENMQARYRQIITNKEARAARAARAGG